MNQNDQQIKPLDQVSFNAIAGAFARLQMLANKSVDAGPGDNTAAEKEQLIAYLATEMLAHAGEFLACYDLVHREYLPACNALLRIAKRCGYHPTSAPVLVKPENN